MSNAYYARIMRAFRASKPVLSYAEGPCLIPSKFNVTIEEVINRKQIRSREYKILNIK